MQVNLPDQLREHKNIVTFDFEDTMTLPAFNPKSQLWEHSIEPNYRTLVEIVRLTTAGYRCIAVSEASPDDKQRWQLRQFFQRHSLPVSSSIFTGGQDTAPLIAAVGSQMHYDDDPYVILSLAEYEIVGILVPHPAEYLTPDEYRKAINEWK